MGLGIHFVWVLASAAVILLTAEFAINAAVSLARRFGISDEFIGMSVLAIGTSIPEIMTNVVGAVSIVKEPALYGEVSSLILGTTIGSDIFQQNFLVSVVALIGLLAVARKHLVKDVGGLIAATVLLMALAWDGTITRAEGLVLVVVYAGYLLYLHKYGHVEKDTKVRKGPDHWFHNIAILVSSFVLMALAADILITRSTIIIDSLPISASFFGIFLLGIISAFPELVTSFVALFKGEPSISAGILIGSNITNPLLAIGLGAMISSYAVPTVMIHYDLPIKIATAGLLFYFLYKGRLKHWEAIVMITMYVAYLLFRNHFFPVDILV